MHQTNTILFGQEKEDAYKLLELRNKAPNQVSGFRIFRKHAYIRITTKTFNTDP